MSQLQFIRCLARTAPRVTLERWRRGPARPSWSLPFELFAAALRETSREFGALSWEGQRAAYDALPHARSPALARVEREAVRVGGVQATWFSPRRPASPEITMLYLHGGAYVFGSARSHGDLAARLALACPARTLLPEYRLAPENPFPAGLDDVVAVYRALLDRGISAKRLLVAGDSAGGGLALGLLLRLRDAGEPLPAGAALSCPWVDLTAEGGSLVENAPYDWSHEDIARRWIAAYLAGHRADDPLASPVLADLRGLPPLLVQIGDAELLRDQVARLATRAKEAGVDTRLVVAPDMVHNWHSFAGLFSECGRAIDHVGAFAREVTGVA